MQQSVELTFGDARAPGQLACGIVAAQAALHEGLELLAQVGIAGARARADLRSAEHQGELPLGWVLAEVRQGHRHARAHLLFMAFGEFPGHRDGAIPEQLQQVLEHRQQAVGGLVEDQGALLLG